MCNHSNIGSRGIKKLLCLMNNRYRIRNYGSFSRPTRHLGFPTLKHSEKAILPITVLFQNNGTFIDSQNETIKNTTGLWNRIVRGDFNQDGRIDFALGNYGMNSQLKPPLSLYYDDFDNNGSIDPILCVLESGKEYPFLSKDDIQSQLVSLKSKYVSYSSFADQTIHELCFLL